ncbi:Globin-sensor domain-containing protein [Abortiporus biennis]
MDSQYSTEKLTCPYSGSSRTTPEVDSIYSVETATTHPTSQDHNMAGKCPVIFTQEVDPILIKNSLEDRIAYLTDFINFSSHDTDTIKKVAPHVTAIIPELVDEMYAKLFEFDITKKVFMTRNQGFDGPLPSRLEDLTLDSPQITFRKVFMKVWARRVLTSDYTAGKTWAYMDKVGIMHTGVSPFKHQKTMGIKPLNVPYRDCAITLGLVQNILNTAILQVPEDVLPIQVKSDAISAIGKVIWIQNDLFSRHYINE